MSPATKRGIIHKSSNHSVEQTLEKLRPHDTGTDQNDLGLVCAAKDCHNLLMAGFFFWQAFRPQDGQWMIQKMEKWNKATDDPNEPARWVP